MLWVHQIKLAERAYEVLRNLRIVYLSVEMRVGKTLIALETAKKIGAKNVLFVTKKKAIPSIYKDYQNEKYEFKLEVTNYEQLKNYSPEYDLIIPDEAHMLGAFPKPSQRMMQLKKIVGNNYLILLSGTPSPESYSQLFHQFALSISNPFKIDNFYKWVKMGYVDVKQKIVNGVKFNDYSRANQDLIMRILEPYFISFTQVEAGFRQKEIFEKILMLDIDPDVRKLIDRVIRDRYYKFKDESEVVCDTAVKLQNKIHQLYSGTVKTENGDYKILDYSKAKFIKNYYQDKKIAIYYKFIAEGEALKRFFPNWTDSPERFERSSDKIFLSQIASGAMGITLSSADILIFYNIDFSSTNYWQARNRLQAIDRETVPEVHWLFSTDGIENRIYNVVKRKKDYTLYYFTKDFLNGREQIAEKNIKNPQRQGCLFN